MEEGIDDVPIAKDEQENISLCRKDINYGYPKCNT